MAARPAEQRDGDPGDLHGTCSRPKWTAIGSSSLRGASPNDGITAWAEALERGYEGMVAKDPASPYRGGRTLSWLKVKQRDYRAGERGGEPS